MLVDDHLQAQACDPTKGGEAAPSALSAPTMRLDSLRPQKRNRQMVTLPSRLIKQRRIWCLNNDAVGQAYQILRTQILMRLLQEGCRTVAITSPNSRTGTSTVAVNLAVSLSMEFDFTTLLVDANLRHPSVRQMLDLAQGPGLSEHLAEKAPLEDVLVRPDIGRLTVLPGGAPLSYAAEVLRSPMMIKLLHELRDRYTDRLIIFDAPPVLDGADMLAFSPHVDAAVLVVEEGVTTAQDLQRSCELLEQTNLIGVVLSQSREMRMSHSSLFRRRAQPAGITRASGVPVTIDSLAASSDVATGRPLRRISARRPRRAFLFAVLLGVGVATLAASVANGWLPVEFQVPRVFGDTGFQPALLAEPRGEACGSPQDDCTLPEMLVAEPGVDE